MLLKDFNKELRERLRAFVWRQWAQLGLASAQVERSDGWMIDPEALWLLTGTVGRWDPRLFDEVVDWLVINSSFLNIPRLKSVSRVLGFQSMPVVAAMATVVQSNSSRLRWRFEKSKPPLVKEPLFWRGSQPMPSDFGQEDATFLEFGFVRGALELRRMSGLFNPVLPECALLRLRSLCGVTARADILLHLCTHGASHPSAIARDIGFSQKNVQDALVDMSASHIVHSGRLAGRKKTYFVADNDKAGLLYDQSHPAQWVSWGPLFRALELLWWKLLELEDEPIESSVLSSELRTLSRTIRELAERADHRDVFREHRGITGAAFTHAFLDDLDVWLKILLNEV